MLEAHNFSAVLFYSFFIAVGLIFVLNITFRFIRNLNRLDIFFIFAIIFIGSIYIFSAINFNSDFVSNRNVQRATDVNIISTAIQEYIRGTNASPMLLGPVPRCPEVNYIGSGSGYIDLHEKLKNISLPVLPVDPIHGDETNSGYTMCVTDTSRVIIAAPFAENGKVILMEK